MRIARVMGIVTLGPRLGGLKPGRYLLVDVLDEQAVWGLRDHAPRKSPMPESLVVFDDMGASAGQIIAVSEGAEATQPFAPDRVPIDAYAAAILDNIEVG